MARETSVQYQVGSYQRLQNGTALFNTQVRIKGKVEQSGGRSSTLSYTSVL